MKEKDEGVDVIEIKKSNKKSSKKDDKKIQINPPRKFQKIINHQIPKMPKKKKNTRNSTQKNY